MSNLESIIKGCLDGDRGMQKELYERYSPRFYALCRRYAPDDAVAQEMLVEGFLLVFQRISTFRGSGSFEGWMYKVFLHQILRIYHRDRRHMAESFEDHHEQIHSKGSDFAAAIDVQDALLRALRRLDERQRVLFNLIAVEGYSFVEAAEMYDLPVSTLKSQYYKVRDQLQVELRAYLE